MYIFKRFLIIGLVMTVVLVSCGAAGQQSTTDENSGQSETPSTVGQSEETAQTPEETNATAQAANFQQVFRQVAKEVLPVVVEVNVVDVVQAQQPQSPFEFFFGPEGGQDGEQREFKRQGLGSGVTVRRDGSTTYVLTNAHVVSEVDQVSVTLSDGREFEAKIVGTDRRLDLALLSFEADGEVPVAELGDSSSLQVGDWVVAVGNPLGFESTVTSGIVSALGRSAPQQGQAVSNVTNFIQTDAAINPGNSGGALANLDGEIVGINTWIASRSGGSVGLGFAIPVNNARKAVEDFIEHGKVVYGWLGVSIGDADPQAYPNVREDLGLGDASGALVSNVYTGSPAANDGIQPGDFITSANGNSIESAGQLTRVVGGLRPGDTVEFELIRYGEQRTVSVDITQRRPEEDIQQQTGRVWPGIYVINPTDQIAEQLNLGGQEGVIVRAAVQGSPAAQSGVRQGDLITVVNGQSIDSMQSFYRALNERGDGADQVRIIRQGTHHRAADHTITAKGTLGWSPRAR